MEELIICGRPELGDEYLCEKLDDGQHGHGGKVDPIVRVLTILRYPRQRAISMPDVVSEVSPVPAWICRLHYLRPATEEEAGRYASWRASAEALQDELLRDCVSDEEREILERHRQGIYRERSSVRFYKAYEFEAARAAWQRIGELKHDQLCDGDVKVPGLRGP